MAIRDAGDFGYDLTFEDAVRKGRREGWSDRDIAAMLTYRTPPPSVEDVGKVPQEPVVVSEMRLEDIVFRHDTIEGGKVIEYVVEGRKKTQTVPKMVGDILEAVVRRQLKFEEALKEIASERSTVTSGGNGESGPAVAGPRVTGPKRRPAVKGKAKPKAYTKAAART
jgi:hypothetical protein